MTQPGFIHLHVHSAYSLLEGALPLGNLLELAASDRQPAVGVADNANLFGALELSEKAVGKGIQPLAGCELAIKFDEDSEPGKARNFGKETIVLMAMNRTGFVNLSEIVSRAYMEGDDGNVLAPVDWLEGDHAEGLICLSGGPEGAIDPLFLNGQEGHAQTRLKVLHKLFGDRLYIELQRHGRPDEHLVEPHLVEFAYANDIPLVATNEPFFPKEADFEAHDALLAIAGSTVLA
jgi:DNA polymerase-3 subunit alpha